MHNLTKIRIFRILLCVSYPFAIIFVWPIVLLKKKHKGSLFFFFDRYVIGGAQRIHIDILNSVKEEDKKVFFTRLSANDKFKEEFYNIPNSENQDIHFWCDNLILRLFSVHFYAFYLNRHKEAHVFSSNSTFFYDMLFFLNKNIVTTELLHNFTYGKNGMEHFGLANYKHLDFRIVYDNLTLHNIQKQYKELNVPSPYSEKILFIEPGVQIPTEIIKDFSLPLKILYAGRGGTQKRIYLLDEIATRCLKERLPVEFHFAGTMMDELSDYIKDNCVLHGEISRQEDMYQLYKNCHAILMTSAYEGFPMLIKESMACACVPIVTALEGNKTHLKHQENALLIADPEDEPSVIDQGYKFISDLIGDNEHLKFLSGTARQYAIDHFDKTAFQIHINAFFATH